MLFLAPKMLLGPIGLIGWAITDRIMRLCFDHLDAPIERDRGAVPAFARVLIETSGLADPAPVMRPTIRLAPLRRWLG